MTNVLICGGAGTLGAGLSRLLIDKGYNVSVLDIIRYDEAWKLSDAGIRDKVEYLWKSTVDITEKDLDGVEHTLLGNLLPPLHLLEVVKGMKKKPFLVYPSSFNARYGHKVNTTLTEETFPMPSTQYGWTKGAVELLYQVYNKSFGVPIVILVVGSGYGPRMRSDELVGRYILHTLQGKKEFRLRSPEAKRMWSYAGDFLSFYDKLIDNIEAYNGMVLHCAGNKGDRVVTNTELTGIINSIAKKKGLEPMSVVPMPYEAGEMIDGKPIDFGVDSSKTRQLLKWEPKFTLEEGLSATMDWFSKNMDRYK
jgi:dTDP-glucose 4,6-dehydratase